MKLLTEESLQSYAPELKTKVFELPPSKGSTEPESIILTEWNGNMRDVWEVFLMNYIERHGDSDQRRYRAFAVILSMCSEDGTPLFAERPLEDIERLAGILNARIPHILLYEIFDYLDHTNLITLRSRKEALGNSKGTSDNDSGTNSQNVTDVPSAPSSE